MLLSRSSPSLWISAVGQEASHCHSGRLQLSLGSGSSFAKTSPPLNLYHIENSMATQQYSTPYAGKRVSLGDPEREFPLLMQPDLRPAQGSHRLILAIAGFLKGPASRSLHHCWPASLSGTCLLLAPD